MQKIVSLLLSALLFSCSAPKNNVEDFDWLQGQWIGASGEMKLFENWEPLKDNALKGEGGGYVGADTAFCEAIKIEQRGDTLFYVVSVKGSNELVDFKFTGYKMDSAVFENPLHDFPQRILYFQLPNNKLYACIDGLNAGKYERVEFFYEKVKHSN
jgi:hypothetical protein